VHDVDEEIGGLKLAQQLRGRALLADAEAREVVDALLQVGRLLRADQRRQPVQPLVRDLDDRERGLIRRAAAGGQVAGRQRLEQRGLAGRRETDKGDIQGSASGGVVKPF